MVQAIVFFGLFVSSVALAGQTKVAVIDTGLDINDSRFKSVLCKSGHRDFTGTGLNDTDGHGTHVSGLIKQGAEGSNFCLLILKYHTGKAGSDYTYLQALTYAYNEGADVINYSSGGGRSLPAEENLIRSHPIVFFVAAAGNDGRNLDEDPRYPASYPIKMVIVVGNLSKDGRKSSSSNYGRRVTEWEFGELAWSTLPKGNFGYLSGSSMSAAIYTGKLVKRISQ